MTVLTPKGKWGMGVMMEAVTSSLIFLYVHLKIIKTLCVLPIKFKQIATVLTSVCAGHQCGLSGLTRA